jgi:hypothetical protein
MFYDDRAHAQLKRDKQLEMTSLMFPQVRAAEKHTCSVPAERSGDGALDSLMPKY